MFFAAVSRAPWASLPCQMAQKALLNSSLMTGHAGLIVRGTVTQSGVGSALPHVFASWLAYSSSAPPGL